MIGRCLEVTHVHQYQILPTLSVTHTRTHTYLLHITFLLLLLLPSSFAAAMRQTPDVVCLFHVAKQYGAPRSPFTQTCMVAPSNHTAGLSGTLTGDRMSRSHNKFRTLLSQKSPRKVRTYEGRLERVPPVSVITLNLISAFRENDAEVAVVAVVVSADGAKGVCQA